MSSEDTKYADASLKPSSILSAAIWWYSFLDKVKKIPSCQQICWNIFKYLQKAQILGHSHPTLTTDGKIDISGGWRSLGGEQVGEDANIVGPCNK